jgi:cysteine synthase A
MPGQFDNPANPAIHYKTTGEEIWRDTDGKVDAFVAGVGTGGTVTGVGKLLTERNPNIYVATVEPDTSTVLSGGAPGPHKLQGFAPGFVPSILDTHIYKEVFKASYDDSIATSRRLAREEGILVGISAGSNVWAALQLAARPEFAGKTIVTIGCDTGERYLSHPLFSEIDTPLVEAALA